MTGELPLQGLLRNHRRHADLTLEALAELSGVSDRAISDIERGVSTGPQRRTILALSDALNLSPSNRDAFLAAARAGRRIAGDDARVIDLAPHRLADFTGRADEVRTVLGHLATGDAQEPAPMVIICGAPGVGKTTVAVEALHQWRVEETGMFFVHLGGLDAMPLSPLKVLQALLRQGAPNREVPSVLGAAASAWHELTETFPATVLLDDAFNEAQIRLVRGAGPGSVVVVTSRRSLAGIEGAGRVMLGALPASDSVELLRRIIPEPQALTGDIAELARLCDDIPLALRIAGNRLASQPQWTVEDFAERLRSEGKRLHALVAGDLGIESAFALSYDQLDPVEKEIFRNLSLIEGSSFDAALAAAIGPDLPDAAEESLDRLAALGLITALRGNRYRIPELLRLFAAARLRAEVPTQDIAARRLRLREWLLDMTATAGRQIETGEAAPNSSAEKANRWLTMEADHWYAAYKRAADMGAHTKVLELASSLRHFAEQWVIWGHWHELFSTSAAAATSLGDDQESARHQGYREWAHQVEISDHDGAKVGDTREHPEGRGQSTA
ncbi:helix-turn-helix domain-containing protein [Arthrobacter sp. ERGS1:01]|uniref:helix-turn-helix domain-containing protein n=1 Tax=Arthrobacter sp. ERGS1:01 TaxID=1704044 RepID=UPI000ACE5552|nr:helix-turn-helix domain-containing protein [Arthrobacter sp. ERGS1:01]